MLDSGGRTSLSYCSIYIFTNNSTMELDVKKGSCGKYEWWYLATEFRFVKAKANLYSIYENKKDNFTDRTPSREHWTWSNLTNCHIYICQTLTENSTPWRNFSCLFSLDILAASLQSFIHENTFKKANIIQQ